jgi:uncharacterized repeat protein (TIGR03803 family)
LRTTRALLMVAAMAAAGTARAATYTDLHDFGGSDGARPVYQPVLGPHGTLYGTTYAGGPDGAGTVYKFSGGNLTTLLTGAQPEPAPVVDSDGNLYLSFLSGGAHGKGSIARWDPVNGLTTLYSFTGGADGWYPNGLTLTATARCTAPLHWAASPRATAPPPAAEQSSSSRHRAS